MRLTGARKETGGETAQAVADRVGDQPTAPENRHELAGQTPLSAQEGDTFLPEAERIARRLEDYIARSEVAEPAAARGDQNRDDPLMAIVSAAASDASPPEELAQLLAALQATESEVPDRDFGSVLEPSAATATEPIRIGPSFPNPPAPEARLEQGLETGMEIAFRKAGEPHLANSDAGATVSVPLPEPSMDIVFHKSGAGAPSLSAPKPAAPVAKKTPKPAKEKKRGRLGKRAALAPKAVEGFEMPEVTSTSRPPEPATEPDGGPRHSGRPLGEILIGRGLVSEDQLRTALTTQTGSGKRLGNILVELGLLSERGLVEVLAEQLQLEIIDLGRMELDREVVNLLPEENARSLLAVPIANEGDRVDVAVADPLRENLQEELIQQLGLPVRLLFATKTDVDQVINKMYVPEADLGDALRMFEAKLEARKASTTTETSVTTVVDENAPVVKVVNLILEQAVRERASDVHIEPMEHLVRVRVRTDGALHQVMTLPGAMGASLISRIKVMSDMNIVERRKPQDGQLAVSIAGRELDVRVSTTPTVFGEKCVLRVLDKTKAVINLPGLGMATETYERYSDLIRSPYGMVICAGPTGSGKTTTLYATLSAINNIDINVVTIEDPVEYVFPEINQIQINEAGGLTFANGLRAILRQDPDAILVGEIRDVETARIAVQAALTGHFVMSSLHATDATSALHRFMDMGIEAFLIASSLLGVVGQRLVRKVCPHCIVEYSPTPDELTFYQRGGGELEKTTFVQGAGCNFCGETGYYDRIGIYEVLAITDEMKELIVTNAPHAELKRLAIEQGMRTLREQAVDLVTQDKTTIAEVLRTVYVL